MRFLITAGPTREYIDPVRFISNGSTGKMGFACAEAAVRGGHKVTLVSGPVALTVPKEVKRIDVVSCREMAGTVFQHFDRCDCVIMTAAVCDYQPSHRVPFKISKGKGPLSLELERTRDILAELGKKKQNQILIGFAVQDRAPRQNASRKLKTKNLDAVILNQPAAFGAEKSDIEILPRDGKWKSYPQIKKTSLATIIIKLAEKLCQNRSE